ncbi:MAG: DHH family phosphoesterase, partial [Planctomycetes bacterium]|nr:DHH family phosphoesterase [Planctomycetota bacterium]
MCEKSASKERDEVAGRLKAAERPLLVAHSRPDGDALGSMAALWRALAGAGKKPRTFVPGDVPPRYAFLFADGPCTDVSQFSALADSSDLIVVIDTCAFTQLDGLENMLRERAEKTIVIDHHATGDEVGSLRWRDPSAAAAGVMVAELLDVIEWPVDERTAEALMTAIVTDTGWLRFANTSGRCLRVVGALVDAGVRPDKLYSRIYQQDRPQRLALRARMLETLELSCHGKIAAMIIRKADFQATGARSDETENLVN